LEGIVETKRYAGSTGANLPANIEQKLKDAEEKRNSGAVSTFTEERASILLESIIDGSTVKQACEKIGISRVTFYAWRSLVPGFLNMTKRAHQLQADSMVDDNVELLESVDTEGKEGMARLRKAEQIARFKFDLAKCLNDKYIEKKQNMNLNINASVTNADISRWFNK
jgi:transposase-like protein